ncbi:MAG: transcriptional regulator, MarR family, partial [Cyanobacteria bacterium RYN_339]|nr:transcriptional regulator, MarR family [Cyanobacteria bacterium RYN_339]
MKFWSEFRQAVTPELRLLRGNPKLWGACLAIVAVPSVYSVTYLSSVWDPYGHLPDLPVALVNQDQGADYQGQHVDVGGTVIKGLLEKHTFRFQALPTPDAAREALARGEVYFALIIPPTFSANSLPGQHPGGNRLELLTAPGASYSAALIGRRFAGEVANRVNDQLDGKRWEVMLANVGKLKAGVRQLKDGAFKLDQGAHQLRDGTGQLVDGSGRAAGGSTRLAVGAGQVAGGVHRLTDGMGRVTGGVRLMTSKLPPNADLDRLAAGSKRLAGGVHTLDQGLAKLDAGGRQLAAGTLELGKGLGQLEAGGDRLAAGAKQLEAGARKVPFVGGQLGDGAAQVADGANRLHTGLVQAQAGGQRLEAGAGQLQAGLGKAAHGATELARGQDQLDGGVQKAAAGLKKLGAGLRLMESKLPAAADLRRLDAGAGTVAAKTGELATGLGRLDTGAHRLQDGSGKLAAGSRRLAVGLALLDRKLAAAPDATSVAELATPVTVTETQLAPVASNGVAFAPYFMALSLWMGAVMTTFVFHFIKLPESNRAVGQRARMWSKVVLPGVIVLAQAVTLATVLMLGLHVPVPHVVSFYAICMLGSVTFLVTLMALIMILGDAGKLVAIVLLVFQLGAAGGAYPVELTGGVFAKAHPYLPVSNMVDALRACLFGAYNGRWGYYVAAMLAFGWGAWLLAVALGRHF